VKGNEALYFACFDMQGVPPSAKWFEFFLADFIKFMDAYESLASD
jgi:hypothetical protein